MARWRIEIIGKKLRQVGTVEANTAEQAVDEAAKLFGVESAVRDKLVATKVPTPEK
jgi:hypothetical protein